MCTVRKKERRVLSGYVGCWSSSHAPTLHGDRRKQRLDLGWDSVRQEGKQMTHVLEDGTSPQEQSLFTLDLDFPRAAGILSSPLRVRIWRRTECREGGAVGEEKSWGWQGLFRSPRVSRIRIPWSLTLVTHAHACTHIHRYTDTHGRKSDYLLQHSCPFSRSGRGKGQCYLFPRLQKAPDQEANETWRHLSIHLTSICWVSTMCQALSQVLGKEQS